MLFSKVTTWHNNVRRRLLSIIYCYTNAKLYWYNLITILELYHFFGGFLKRSVLSGGGMNGTPVSPAPPPNEKYITRSQNVFSTRKMGQLYLTQYTIIIITARPTPRRLVLLISYRITLEIIIRCRYYRFRLNALLVPRTEIACL